ncbi:fibronectin-binding domain-containing protein [Archaeoglobales archaeon]|nr:MAG: fibronectin-binding domain-containing protein [Archaeoglobales archaeon]
MKQMTSFDIKACIEELQFLINGRVDKIYHYPPDEIRIKIYAGERYDLIIEAGKRIHLTQFPKESPRFPSPFAMLLRKHLEGSRIKGIKQHNFDRIVLLDFERRDEKKTLIVELFSRGNIILTEGDRIVMPLKQKNLRVGDKYKLPTPINFELDFKSNEEIVRYLAKSGFGGLYAEEICQRAFINKRKVTKELSNEELKRIRLTIRDLVNFKKNPQIIINGDKYIDVVPMDLQNYLKFNKKYFKTFNEALDVFYSKFTSEEEFDKAKDKELKKLKRRLEIQKKAKEQYELEERKFRRIAEIIYENYRVVDRIIESFRQIRERSLWPEVSKEIAKDEGWIIKRVRPEKNSVVVSISGLEFELDVTRTIHENVERYYNLSKKAKEKAIGVEKAIENTLNEIKSVEEKIERRYASKIRVRRRKEWYENYRWFITSDGFLVIGGRSAKMNEEIVSKHLENKDLFFHTQSPGAPVVILKNGTNAPKSSIREAAIFAASYSSLWKEGKYSGDVYYVYPNQVSKAAKHGEYLPRGGFYITGKRNYISVELNCAVGVELSKLRVIGGPTDAIKRYADYYIEIEIGDKDPNELSVEISKRLAGMAGDEEHIVRAIATPDEVAKFLPPGRSKIKL